MKHRLTLVVIALICTLTMSASAQEERRSFDGGSVAARLLTLFPALAAAPESDTLLIPLRPTDTSVTCQVGDHLQIAGSVTMQNTFDSCLLLVDGVVVETRTPSIPVDNYNFTWTPQTPGTHTLELRYMTFHAKATVRRLFVTAADSPPAVFSDLPDSAATDTAVSVVGVGSRPFPLARVDFYFNNKPLAVATSAPFAVTLPIEAITQPGTYTIKFVAYDGAGHPFYPHASKIEVPQRVQVTVPRTFTLRTAGDKVNLTASVLTGIKVAKVSFSIVHADASHYETLADVTSAPYSAEVDLSTRASGDYWVRAIATSAAGNSYEAGAVQLTLTNMPDDKRVVQEAKDRAAAEVKAAAIAAAVAADNAKWNADSLAPDVLDANAQAAFKKGLIKISLTDDPRRVGTKYYVDVSIQNLSKKPVRIFPPDIVFDDFSSDSLYPEEEYASKLIFVNVNTGATRQVQFKTLGLGMNENSFRKPTRIKFESGGSQVLSLPIPHP